MIGLIVPANLKFSPYVRQYQDCCSNQGLEYEIISWNKFGIEEKADHVFQCIVQTSKRDLLYGLGRMATWIRFARFAKRICRDKNYDKLIVFTAQLGVFLAPYLVNHYDGKYLLDIRDDSPILHLRQNRFNRVVDHAAEVVVSSPDFDFWESDRKGILSHNAEMEAVEKGMELQPRPLPRDQFRIVAMGDMGGFELNHRLVDALGGDDRFTLLYIGRENIERNRLEEYSKTRSFANVIFRGSYEKKDVYDIYQQEGDLVNILREKNRFNQYALPNKLYEGVIAGLPVITLKGNVSLSRLIRQYSLGIIVGEIPEEAFGDVLAKAVKAFDQDAYSRGRKEFLRMVLEDQHTFLKKLEGFLSA